MLTLNNFSEVDSSANFEPKAKGIKKGIDSDYIKSGVWKCSQSPTGAHHSIITGGVMKCKYCGKESAIPKIKR